MLAKPPYAPALAHRCNARECCCSGNRRCGGRGHLQLQRGHLDLHDGSHAHGSVLEHHQLCEAERALHARSALPRRLHLHAGPVSVVARDGGSALQAADPRRGLVREGVLDDRVGAGHGHLAHEHGGEAAGVKHSAPVHPRGVGQLSRKIYALAVEASVACGEKREAGLADVARGLETSARVVRHHHAHTPGLRFEDGRALVQLPLNPLTPVHVPLALRHVVVVEPVELPEVPDGLEDGARARVELADARLHSALRCLVRHRFHVLQAVLAHALGVVRRAVFDYLRHTCPLLAGPSALVELRRVRCAPRNLAAIPEVIAQGMGVGAILRVAHQQQRDGRTHSRAQVQGFRYCTSRGFFAARQRTCQPLALEEFE
mmetsp:Transcript_16228/g.44027  ORF Transcript_16228/g.44027 Transcript_16228/m.44027 type:complete len:374 (-) Transcript_16228:805-1926(-)